MQDLATLRAGGYRAAGLTKLKLTETLTEFPREILDLGDTLELLDLSGTHLSALPADLGPRLPNLRIAFFSNCQFNEFPSAMAACPRLEMVAFRGNGMTAIGEDALPTHSLRWLILTDNRLASLPASIGRCACLEKCMLSGNRLQALPDTMAQCQNLTLLRLAANRLTAPLPSWLFTMPKLAFLSFAGNPCSANYSASGAADAASLPHIDWNEIEISHVLGEGASGVISQGTIRSGGTRSSSRALSGQTTPSLSGTSTPALSVSGSVFSTVTSLSSASSTASSALGLTSSTPVAVKVFRGALTSDGTPYDEMAACLAAGQHMNLVSVHGQIRWEEDREDDGDEAGSSNAGDAATAKAFRGGLVMDLIPKQYRVLGQPPSFATCTRDCFPDEARGRLPPAAALTVLTGVAAAAEHLHARGIAHGDLYAHNILVRGTASSDADDSSSSSKTHAILSDFGAATLYGRGQDAPKYNSDGDDDNNFPLLEKLEVLAFAHLVEDVLGLLAAETEEAGCPSPSIRDQLLQLRQRCALPTVADRPTFAAVKRELASIQAGM